MTAETVMRRIGKISRENIAAFSDWEQKPKIGSGAKGEARGTVQTSHEILNEIRALRKEARR